MKDLKVIGYSDIDFAGDVEDRKSTSGQVFFIGGRRSDFVWSLNSHKIVSKLIPNSPIL